MKTIFSLSACTVDCMLQKKKKSEQRKTPSKGCERWKTELLSHFGGLLQVSGDAQALLDFILPAQRRSDTNIQHPGSSRDSGSESEKHSQYGRVIL